MSTHERNALHGKGRTQIRRTDRAGQACLACASAKVKCQDRKPCRHCRSKNIACETAPLVNHQPNVSVQEAFESPPASQSAGENIPAITVPQIVLEHDGFHNVLGEVSSAEVAISADPYHHMVTPRGYGRPGNIPSTAAFPLNSDQFGLENAVDGMLFIPNPADFNNQIFDFDFHDFDFDFEDEHVGLINPSPKHVTMAEFPDSGRINSKNKGSGSIEAASRRHAAFVRSPWLWTPAPKDHVLSDQDNLTLDEESIPSPLTTRSPGLLPIIPSCGIPVIGNGLRDKMFYLISSMNKYTNRAPSFPSLNILNHIIEAFFIRHSYQIDHWIHVPSISLNDVHPEFAIALITAGTMVIAVPEIWKLGLVLQDVVRVTVGELVNFSQISRLSYADTRSGREKTVVLADCSRYRHGCSLWIVASGVDFDVKWSWQRVSDNP